VLQDAGSDYSNEQTCVSFSRQNVSYKATKKWLRTTEHKSSNV